MTSHFKRLKNIPPFAAVMVISVCVVVIASEFCSFVSCVRICR